MNQLELNWVMNKMPPSDDRYLEIMSLENVEKARQFHQSFPQYNVTAMANLKKMAEYLGLGGIYVKDERFRFGLNAFKVLGASFAMGRYIAHEMGEHVTDITYDDLTSPELKENFGTATFFTATDGNHGRGVAWAARRLHQKAVVHMPKGSAKSRYDNIAKEKAKVTIEDLNYDDCVRLAAKEAAQTEHGVVIQDTAWDGYEKVPAWIVQGYLTMAEETAEELDRLHVLPSHIFLQAGVGSMAGGILAYFADRCGTNKPTVAIVEPDVADCIYQSAKSGEIRSVDGIATTMMAGLNCGTPCKVIWPILRDYAEFCISGPDAFAVNGMRTYAAGLHGDPVIVSGESGASTLGAAQVLLEEPDYQEVRKAMGIDQHSILLFISTEGATDPENYRKIVDSHTDAL